MPEANEPETPLDISVAGSFLHGQVVSGHWRKMKHP